jgi:hypothetical protein
VSDATEIAYCGLYCGDCIIRKHQMGKLAVQLLEATSTPAFAKLAAGLPELMPETFAPLKNHEGLCRVLAAIGQLDCVMPCRSGGGTSGCRIRECCTATGMNGCWECGEFESCPTLAWLNPVEQGANVANLRILRDRGIEEFLAERRLRLGLDESGIGQAVGEIAEAIGRVDGDDLSG